MPPGTMRHTPLDRIGLRDSLAGVREDNDYITTLIPTITEVTSDVDTGGGRDVSSGDGTGRTATWLVCRISCMIRDVDVNLVTFGHVPPGAQIGDVIVAIGPRDYPNLDMVLRNENAYIVCYGDTYRPTGISREGVTRAEEYLVTIRKFGAINLRKAGY